MIQVIAHRLAAVALAVWAFAPTAPARAELRDAELRSEIEAFALDYAGAPPFAMEIPSLRDFTAPSASYGRVEVDLSTHASGPVRGSLPVTVRLRSDGEEFKRGIVTVRLSSDRPVLVAARPLAAGQVIRESDLRREPASNARLSRRGLDDPSQLIGRRVTRNVRVGGVLRSDLVTDVPVIYRGSMVRIRLQRGSLRIEALGRAREDGAPGQPLRVLNLESRREIVGVVQADGVVHVQF